MSEMDPATPRTTATSLCSANKANSTNRERIRCPHCNLNQFLTRNDLCRRCHKPFWEVEGGKPEPAYASQPRPSSSLSQPQKDNGAPLYDAALLDVLPHDVRARIVQAYPEIQEVVAQWRAKKGKRASPEALTQSAIANNVLAFFPFNLRYVRKKMRKMSQREVARRMNLSRTYISRLERGGRVPKIESIVRLAHVLSVHPHVMIRTLKEWIFSLEAEAMWRDGDFKSFRDAFLQMPRSQRKVAMQEITLVVEAIKHRPF